MIGSGSICASQRSPTWIVRFGMGCQTSWMKTAGSFCVIVCVPASSTEMFPTPACWR